MDYKAVTRNVLRRLTLIQKSLRNNILVYYKGKFAKTVRLIELLKFLFRVLILNYIIKFKCKCEWVLSIFYKKLKSVSELRFYYFVAFVHFTITQILTVISVFGILYLTFNGSYLQTKVLNNIILKSDNRSNKDDTVISRYIGEGVSLHCDLLISDLTCNSGVLWRLNNKTILPNYNHIITFNQSNIINITTLDVIYTRTQSILQIHSISRSDFGVYSCAFYQCDTGTDNTVDDSSDLDSSDSDEEWWCLRDSIKLFHVIEEESDKVLVPILPGGILSLFYKYNTISSVGDTVLVLKRNNVDIKSYTSRSSCSLYVSAYYYFVYGGHYPKLESRTSTYGPYNVHGISYQDCIDENGYGTYELIIEKMIYKDSNESFIAIAKHPSVFEVVPYIPDFFQNRFYNLSHYTRLSMSPLSQLCWTKHPPNTSTIPCYSIIDSFLSEIRLFFLMEYLLICICVVLLICCYFILAIVNKWLVLGLYRLIKRGESRYLRFENGNLKNVFDVYISCHNFDAGVAKKIEKILETERVKVFWEDRWILPGQPNTSLLAKYMTLSRAFIVIASDYYLNDAYKNSSEISCIIDYVRNHKERLLILKLSDEPIANDILKSYTAYNWNMEIENNDNIVKNWIHMICSK